FDCDWSSDVCSSDLVFLSHSSIDKPIIEQIFFELQKEEIKVWFDKYEIKGGDSITDKLNEGLGKSDLGLICLSKNFLNSNWSRRSEERRVGKECRYV